MNMKKILIGERGVSLLTAIMLLLLLSVLGLAVVSLVMVESQISVNQLYSLQAFSLAEAGIERGIRAIRDDTIAIQFDDPTAAGYCVTPSLDGYSAYSAGELNGSNYEMTLFYGTTLANSSTPSYCTLNATIGADVQVYDFQQRYNLRGTPIIGMEIGIRAIKSGTGTADPIVQLQYTLNGSWTSPTNVGSPITVSATSFGAPVFTTMSVTPTWNDLMAAGGSNFRIRAYRNNAEGYYLEIDYLCIRVMLKADSSAEPWFTTFGTPITWNIALGNGVVESLPIDDEAGKVHLNYATQSLLRYLMVECGIADATANTLATNIVTYRGSNWFDSIEEVMQVTGMTSTYYDLIKNYITVYPWVNTNVQIPTGSRAPININTAPLQVLKAVFDPLALEVGDAASLASAIITQRTGTADCIVVVPPNPFSSMISSNPGVNPGDSSSSFARFLDTQTSYLTAAEIDAIKENCDASYYNETQTSSWTGGSVTTTEFCYSSNVYSVTAKCKVENSYRQVKRVFTDTGTFDVPIPSWGTTLNYWREIVP
ncbi:MAG: type II secretion system protein GspK [Proteobacteria bacterium]|nr:type II secretion system protein GspK [Pseudomonadota bacterium]